MEKEVDRGEILFDKVTEEIRRILNIHEVKDINENLVMICAGNIMMAFKRYLFHEFPQDVTEQKRSKDGKKVGR